MPETVSYTPKRRVDFEPNTPQCVRLKYPVGKIVSGMYGEQIYYSLSDGRVMYLDLAVGQKVNELACKPGEPILIMKKWSGKRTDRPEWHVWKDDGSDPEVVGKLAESMHLVRQVGPQRDGTFVVPSAPAGASARTTAAAPAPAAAPCSDGQPPKNGTNSGNSSASGSPLLAEAKALVDIFAEAWMYASAKYEGRVKPDDVKSFVITAFIQHGKGGAR